ncbi:hypothetical protein PZB74_11010 [Porifericola rhodea]|uniref:hypothetical protein n=1 Tax=Porifericola rhodea TaxID=930972 RepID=UPI00266556DE|nr:hypothetical protein [Porifericola rhodea]WKN33853.1 hypothetical protein PZB74_11010 [Porifericola rhodea]
MKTSFLDYYKLILEKVSFDPQLLTKEYRKALNALHAQEAQQLESWLIEKGLHPHTLSRTSSQEPWFANANAS